MEHFSNIISLASDRHGYFTAMEARSTGIKSCELVRWVKSGRLEYPARGVYRMADFPPSQFDSYILAVLSVGKDAALYGESVLGILNLVPTNPATIYVAAPLQIRKKLGNGVKVVRIALNSVWDYEGISLQDVADAIRSSRGIVRDDRRIAASREARRQGYISRLDCTRLERAIRNEASA